MYLSTAAWKPAVSSQIFGAEVWSPARRIDAGSVPNNASVVLVAEVGGVRVLLTGDVLLTQGGNVLAGERMTVDLATGVARQVAWHRGLREQSAEAVALGHVAAEATGTVL